MKNIDSRAEEQRRPDLLVVCVHYRDERNAVTLACDVLERGRSLNHRFVVVDNSGTFLDEEVPPHLTDKMLTLRPAANLGYFGGARYATQRCFSTWGVPDWTVVCNTDLTFDVVELMSALRSMSLEPPADVIAPCIVSSGTGSNQNPFMLRRPSKWRMRFYAWLFERYWLYALYSRLHEIRQRLRVYRRRGGIVSACDIYAPHGAFMIFSHSYFEAGATLDYGAFLFGEEIFVAEEARRLGLRVLYVPEIQVSHFEHVSTGLSREMVAFRAQAASYCAQQYFGSAK